MQAMIERFEKNKSAVNLVISPFKIEVESRDLFIRALTNNTSTRVLILQNLDHHQLELIAEGIKENKMIQCLDFENLDPSTVITNASDKVLLMKIKKIDATYIETMLKILDNKPLIQTLVLDDLTEQAAATLLSGLTRHSKISRLTLKSRLAEVSTPLVINLSESTKPFTLSFDATVAENMDKVRKIIMELHKNPNIAFSGTTIELKTAVLKEETAIKNASELVKKRKEYDPGETEEKGDKNGTKHHKTNGVDITEKKPVEKNTPRSSKGKKSKTAKKLESSEDEVESLKHQVENLEKNHKELEDAFLEKAILNAVNTKILEWRANDVKFFGELNYKLQEGFSKLINLLPRTDHVIQNNTPSQSLTPTPSPQKEKTRLQVDSMVVDTSMTISPRDIFSGPVTTPSPNKITPVKNVTVMPQNPQTPEKTKVSPPKTLNPTKLHTTPIKATNVQPIIPPLSNSPIDSKDSQVTFTRVVAPRVGPSTFGQRPPLLQSQPASPVSKLQGLQSTSIQSPSIKPNGSSPNFFKSRESQLGSHNLDISTASTTQINNADSNQKPTPPVKVSLNLSAVKKPATILTQTIPSAISAPITGPNSQQPPLSSSKSNKDADLNEFGLTQDDLDGIKSYSNV